VERLTQHSHQLKTHRAKLVQELQGLSNKSKYAFDLLLDCVNELK